MRLMFATDAKDDHNPLFLDDDDALAKEAAGTLRAATDEEMAGMSNTLARLLAERTTPSARVSHALNETYVELQNAVKLFGPFNSAHEAYGVIMEEVRELEIEIFKNQRSRNMSAMRTEACQVAAMAMRLMVDLC